MEPSHRVVRRYLSFRKAVPYGVAVLFAVVAWLGVFYELPRGAAAFGVVGGLPYLAAWCFSQGVLWGSFFAVGRGLERWDAWRVRARHRAWVALGPQETAVHRDGEVATIRGTIRALSTVRVHESEDVAAAWLRQRIIRGETEGDLDSIEIRSAAATFDVVGPSGAIARVVGGPWEVREDTMERARTMVLNDGDEVIVRGVVRRRPGGGVGGAGYRDAILEEVECEGGVIAPAQPRVERRPEHIRAWWAVCLGFTALFGGLDYLRPPLPPPSHAVAVRPPQKDDEECDDAWRSCGPKSTCVREDIEYAGVCRPLCSSHRDCPDGFACGLGKKWNRGYHCVLLEKEDGPDAGR
jgi:hypothetical protein